MSDINFTLTVTDPVSANFTITNPLNANLVVNDSILANFNIEGGSVLVSGPTQPYIQFTANTTSNNQSFTDANIATFTSNNYAVVFKNGVSLPPNEYVITGNTLTVNVFLDNGDTILVSPTGSSGNGGGGGGGNIPGISWNSAANIAVGDLFVGYTANVITAGQIYTPNNTISNSSEAFITTQLQSVGGINNIWFANGIYVAAAESGVVFRSTDAINWVTIQTSSTNSLNNVFYHTATSRWIVVGAGGYIATSPDATTWTARTSGTGLDLYSVSGNGSIIVVVGDSGWICTSVDSITWTQRTSGTIIDVYDIDWGNNIFVAVGGASLTLTSPDGITWTSRTRTTSNAYVVTFANGVFVASGFGTAVSSDGITWTTSVAGPVSQIFGLDWNGKYWYAAGRDGIVYTAVSPELVWTQLAQSVYGSSDIIWGINYQTGGILTMATATSRIITPIRNLVYVNPGLQPAPLGTYRNLGSINNSTTSMWTRIS